MKRGRRSLVLVEKDRQRLLRFRARLERENPKGFGPFRKGFGLPALVYEMTIPEREERAPFSWETLQRALAGKPIHQDSHRWILEFLDREVPTIAGSYGHSCQQPDVKNPGYVCAKRRPCPDHDALQSGRDVRAAVVQAIENAKEKNTARTVRGSR